MAPLATNTPLLEFMIESRFCPASGVPKVRCSSGGYPEAPAFCRFAAMCSRLHWMMWFDRWEEALPLFIPSGHALIFTRVLGGIPPWHALAGGCGSGAPDCAGRRARGARWRWSRSKEPTAVPPSTLTGYDEWRICADPPGGIPPWQALAGQRGRRGGTLLWRVCQMSERVCSCLVS